MTLGGQTEGNMPKYVPKEGAFTEPQKGVWKEWAIHVAGTKWELCYHARLGSREREREAVVQTKERRGGLD